VRALADDRDVRVDDRQRSKEAIDVTPDPAAVGGDRRRVDEHTGGHARLPPVHRPCRTDTNKPTPVMRGPSRDASLDRDGNDPRGLPVADAAIVQRPGRVASYRPGAVHGDHEHRVVAPCRGARYSSVEDELLAGDGRPADDGERASYDATGCGDRGGDDRRTRPGL